ncbi:MAG: hypothetical protein M9951_11010 [Burkholderiaceae bacterium]|nr:hypothetical protein [Burkholderiaceae bacterium]MEB2320506.1 hypothetical protein [Pseudomonadota bacterium]
MTEHAITRRKLPAFASLRNVLGIDAITCLAMGLALIALAGPLGELFDLPARLLFFAGLILLPCATLMYAAARSAGPNRALAWTVILGNLAWVLASLGIAVALAPASLGMAFLLAQAAVVAVLAGLEYRGLRATIA